MSVDSGPAGLISCIFSVIIFAFYGPVVILLQIVTVNHESLPITSESKLGLM